MLFFPCARPTRRAQSVFAIGGILGILLGSFGCCFGLFFEGYFGFDRL